LIDLVTQDLQSIELPCGFSGDLVWEFQINKGRVRLVVLDEEASSLTDETVIEVIRRSLLTWRTPVTVNTIVFLTVRITT
jgi:Ca-activated chloride channel family protein